METFLWVEKYRPRSISECILPKDLKDTFSEFVKDKHIPNLILCGSAGVGKTTVAKAMLDEIGATSMMINGSEESGIDVLRTKIKNFASSVSLAGGRKYVILDEADYCNAETVQPALRNFMEEFSKNCGFIMTCNFVNKIIQPLHSRCSVVEFKIANKDKPAMAKELYARILDILKTENISFDEKVIQQVLGKHFPDNRRILNELQRYSATGHIDSGILANLSETSIKELMQLLKDKEFTSVRKWVGKNIDGDVAPMFRKIYDTVTQYVKPSSVPQVVVTLADYQYKSAFVADQEVNFMAFLTELMVETEWQ